MAQEDRDCILNMHKRERESDRVINLVGVVGQREGATQPKNRCSMAQEDRDCILNMRKRERDRVINLGCVVGQREGATQPKWM